MTPGSGVSPIAPPATSASSGPVATAAPAVDDSVAIPIDTEPPAPVVQSGDTAPPPPELAATAPLGVPAAAPMPAASLEPVSVPPGPPVAAVEVGASDPSAVDFDALHAALGEGSREAAPHGAHPSHPAPAAKSARPVAADSQGRSNATYASTDAKAPPAAHHDADLAAPAVIVAQDEPAYPMQQQMTTPMTPAMVMSPGHPSSGPHAIGTPSSGGMRAAQAHPQAYMPTGNTPQAFDPIALGLPPAQPGQVQLTMRMPERPRRPRTPTVVVRARGPSTKQKLFVFSVMLLLVSLIGLGIVMWRAPQLFGLGPKTQSVAKPAVTIPPATATSPIASTMASASPAASSSASASASASAASASASASASAKAGVLKPKGR